MASVHKPKTSKFWYAYFTLPDGRRTRRSTKETRKKKAEEIARKHEYATRVVQTEAQARAVLSDIVEIVTGAPLRSSNIRKFFTAWSNEKEKLLTRGSWLKYSQVGKEFVKFMGERAGMDLRYIRDEDIRSYRDSLSGRLARSSANKNLTILRSALEEAYREGLIDDNPARRVKPIPKPKGEEKTRRPFSAAQLKIVLAHCHGEWKGMVLFSFYGGGVRLGDTARLRWSNLDLTKERLEFTVSKTGKKHTVPLAKPLLTFVAEEMPAGDDPSAPLFPNAFAVATQNIGVGKLSNDFHEILAKAGLVEDRPDHRKREGGKGRSAKRQLSAYSFHSLRDTAVTMASAAGVARSTAQGFTGHDSDAVHDLYTRVDLNALKGAVDSLPDLVANE